MGKNYLKYILSLLIFGSNGIIASGIGLSSTRIVLFRTITGSLFLSAVLLAGKDKPRLGEIKRQLIPSAVSGISMGLSWIFLFEAYRQSGVSTATLMYYCGPVIVMALSPFVFKERLEGGKIFGIVIVLVGMVLVNGADFLNSGLSFGMACGLLSAVLYALMIISNKKIKGISGIEITWMQLITAFVVVFLCSVFTDRSPVIISTEGFIRLLILGIVNTGLGCFLYFSSINVMPAGSVDPLSALVFSSVFLSEHLSLQQAVGAGLILCGAAAGELLFSHRRKNRETVKNTV